MNVFNEWSSGFYIKYLPDCTATLGLKGYEVIIAVYQYSTFSFINFIYFSVLCCSVDFYYTKFSFLFCRVLSFRFHLSSCRDILFFWVLTEENLEAVTVSTETRLVKSFLVLFSCGILIAVYSICLSGRAGCVLQESKTPVHGESAKKMPVSTGSDRRLVSLLIKGNLLWLIT